MREAGELVSATLQLARIGIWLLIDDGRAIRCAFPYQRGRLEAYEGTILHAADFPSYFQAIADSRSVAVFDNVGDGLADEFRDAYLAPRASPRCWTCRSIAAAGRRLTGALLAYGSAMAITRA